MAEELTASQRQSLIAGLQTLQHTLRVDLEDQDRVETVDLDLPIGRISRIDALQQQEMAKAERALKKQRLLQVGAALERVADDEYGWCCDCGESIAYRRLEARPEVPFCVGCQETLER
ncbi:MAG TPA: TraR/DksA family transcriptional regulator [Myxococcota bacterium]|nr:TraR/DksA family transcriptional regulator [Myxococcota bacterium]